VVPSRIRLVSDREHLRRRRTATPIRGNERRLQPDIVPEAVSRLLLDAERDAGLGSGRLEQHRHVDGTGESRVGSRQRDLAAAETGLAEMELGLVRIVSALLELAVEERIALRDRMIVAERAVAIEQGLQHLLAVDAILQREAHILVV